MRQGKIMVTYLYRSKYINKWTNTGKPDERSKTHNVPSDDTCDIMFRNIPVTEEKKTHL